MKGLSPRDIEALARFDAIPREAAADAINTNDHFYVFKIDETKNDVVLYLSCPMPVPLPEKIHNRGGKSTKPHSWRPRLLRKSKKETIFALEMPKSELGRDSHFFIKKKNDWVRIIQPYHADIRMPKGWAFTPYQLYLGYNLKSHKSPQTQRAFVREVVEQGDFLVINGALIASYPVTDAQLALRKFRAEETEFVQPLKLTPATRVWGVIATAHTAYRGEYAYKFSVKVRVKWSELPSSLYSVMVHIGERTTGMFPFNASFGKRTNLLSLDGVTLCVHMDAMANNLRIEKYSFSHRHWPDLYEYVPPKSEKKVCLLGEYTNAARDNSLHLFNYLKKSKYIKPYYVIEAGCGLEGKNVLEFGSIEHVKRSIEADVVAFTHHPTYVLPHLAMRMRKSRPARTLFLQHGVTALKNSMEAYHSSKRRFDAFNVCSDREAADVAKACAYNLKDVVVCGFPRFDRLRKLAQENKVVDNIVVFPTWRRGLDKRTTAEFLETQFYLMWRDALLALREIAPQLGAKVQLVAHPIIARHISAFAEFADEIVDVLNIQDIIVSAGCVITDYSSIAFDALYAGRRAFFYTFDDKRQKFKEEAFIDVDTQLPGTRVHTPQELAAAVVAEWPERQTLNARTLELMPLFFGHVDGRNSARLETVIRQLSVGELKMVEPPVPPQQVVAAVATNAPAAAALETAADAGSETEADGNTEADSDNDNDSNTDGDDEADGDTGSDEDAETDMEADADSETDADAEPKAERQSESAE